MPTYDYTCAKCGEMEVFQSMKDDALTACPGCGCKTFKRQISGGAGIIFKGGGFYTTDYERGSDYKAAAKKDASGGSNSCAGCPCAPSTDD
ncbi:MAG: zinc ribbon domain-containing protein [Planctomycetota bacterium]|jgi:putative FmdB family regulatory protein|nr:zinc ribbon domain-containing protein [Planctomycetota bacterium]